MIDGHFAVYIAENGDDTGEAERQTFDRLTDRRKLTNRDTDFTSPLPPSKVMSLK